jgi:hypothetical protein
VDVWCGIGIGTGVLQRHGQGCIERLRGLEDFNVPLSAPGVQLAPASPNLVESEFCELCVDGVLRSSHTLGSRKLPHPL